MEEDTSEGHMAYNHQRPLAPNKLCNIVTWCLIPQNDTTIGTIVLVVGLMCQDGTTAQPALRNVES